MFANSFVIHYSFFVVYLLLVQQYLDFGLLRNILYTTYSRHGQIKTGHGEHTVRAQPTFCRIYMQLVVVTRIKSDIKTNHVRLDFMNEINSTSNYSFPNLLICNYQRNSVGTVYSLQYCIQLCIRISRSTKSEPFAQKSKRVVSRYQFKCVTKYVFD